tara:strand:- start:1231 stop:1683 length:453 start_codon:yes stop_codon:yes gene_type:complete
MKLIKKEEAISPKQYFRDLSMKIEKKIIATPGSITGKAFDEKNTLKHTFCDGQYVREIFMPAGQIITTKIHKKLHPFFIMSGELSIASEEGIVRVEAPYHGITKPGTKRIIYTHKDTIFITVHATDKTTVEEVVEEISTEDFNDPDIALK